MCATVDDIADALNESGVTRLQPLSGCSDAEILTLESKYDVTLPASYRRFLELMGHHAGGLGDQPTELLYPRVLIHTQHERDTIDRCNKQERADFEYRQSILPIQRFLNCVGIAREPKTPTLRQNDFPMDALIIYMECGLPEFWAIRCINPTDSPVFGFDYEDDLVELRQRYDSLVDFLSSLLEWRLSAGSSR